MREEIQLHALRLAKSPNMSVSQMFSIYKKNFIIIFIFPSCLSTSSFCWLNIGNTRLPALCAGESPDEKLKINKLGPKSRIMLYLCNDCCSRLATPSVYLDLENEWHDHKKTAVGRRAFLLVIFNNKELQPNCQQTFVNKNWKYLSPSVIY